MRLYLKSKLINHFQTNNYLNMKTNFVNSLQREADTFDTPQDYYKQQFLEQKKLKETAQKICAERLDQINSLQNQLDQFKQPSPIEEETENDLQWLLRKLCETGWTGFTFEDITRATDAIYFSTREQKQPTVSSTKNPQVGINSKEVRIGEKGNYWLDGVQVKAHEMIEYLASEICEKTKLVSSTEVDWKKEYDILLKERDEIRLISHNRIKEIERLMALEGKRRLELATNSTYALIVNMLEQMEGLTRTNSGDGLQVAQFRDRVLFALQEMKKITSTPVTDHIPDTGEMMIEEKESYFDNLERLDRNLKANDLFTWSYQLRQCIDELKTIRKMSDQRDDSSDHYHPGTGYM